jgi:hypothetical protein
MSYAPYPTSGQKCVGHANLKMDRSELAVAASSKMDRAFTALNLVTM